MDPQTIAALIQFAQIILAMNTAGFFGVIIVGIKMVRHMGRIEERFDLMWARFKHDILNDEGNDDER